MSHARRTQRRGDQARQRVLEAVLGLLAEGPLLDVPIGNIAERAGMNTTAMLYHYPSKIAIFEETLRWAEERLAEQRATELPKLPGPEQRLARYISLYLPTGPDDPVWKLWLEAWLRAGSNPEIRRLESEIDAIWTNDFLLIAGEGTQTGRLTLSDPQAYAADLTALLSGLSVQIMTKATARTPLLLRALDRVARDTGAELDLMLPELRVRARRRAISAVPEVGPLTAGT